MTSTTTNQAVSSSAPKPPGDLQSAFDNLALLRPAAVNTLDTGLRGGKVNIPETRALTQQLGEANQAFQKHWLSQRTNISLNGRVITVFTPELLALQSFLTLNKIEYSAEDYIIREWCKVDARGFITTISGVSRQNFDHPFSTEPLEGLRKLKTLFLNGRYSDVATIAKLTELEELSIFAKDPAEVVRLKGLKLSSLGWGPCPYQKLGQPTVEESLDMGAFSCLENLQNLTIIGQDCEHTSLSIKSFAPLKNLQKLGMLKLVGVSIDKGCDQVENLQGKSLIIEKCSIKDLSWLESFSSLEKLEITKSVLLSESVKYPSKLSRIDFQANQIHNLAAILCPISELPGFTLVVISRPAGGTYSAEEQRVIEQLRSNKPQIEVVG